MLDPIINFATTVINSWLLLALILFLLGVTFGGDQRLLKGLSQITFGFLTAIFECIFRFLGPLLREGVYILACLIVYAISRCAEICTTQKSLKTLPGSGSPSPPAAAEDPAPPHPKPDKEKNPYDSDPEIV